MNPKELFLILDTNTYLHYLSFTDIDWCKLFSSKKIRLLVPLVILDELDRIKNEHRLSYIRKRSQTVTNLLDRHMENQSQEVRKGVYIEFLDEFDEIDEIRTTYNDDRILYAAKEIISRRKVDVILVTHDLGLTHRAKLRGLNTKKLPDDHKIELIDESEKKKRELEQKYTKLERTFPKLALKFENDSERIERIIQPPSIFPDLIDSISYNSIKDDYDKKIEICREALAKNYLADIAKTNNSQNKTKGKKRNQPDVGQQLEELNQMLRDVPPAELIRFINESEQFLQNYWNYFKQRKQWQDYWKLIIDVKLVIKNDGLVPAHDIEIDIELPDKSSVFFVDPSQFPVQPLVPDPPVEPRVKGVIMGEALIGLWNWVFRRNHLPVNQLNPANQLALPLISNSDEGNIPKIVQNKKKTKISLKKIKHTRGNLLPSLNLYFNNYESAQSFRLDYKVLADNTPEPEQGNLLIVINKPLLLSLSTWAGTF